MDDDDNPLWSNRVLYVSGSRCLSLHRIAILSCRKRSKTVSPMLFISLVVGNPYYQEGILIRKNWGNLFTYTFITPPLSFSGVRERESFPCLFPYLFLLTVSAQRLYRSLERLYRWVLSLTSFARAVVPLPPGGGTATMLCKCWGGGSVHAPLKYRSRFCFDAVLGR